MTPTRTFHHRHIDLPAKVPSGLDRLLHDSYGRIKRRATIAGQLKRESQWIHRRADKLRELSSAQFREALEDMQIRFRRVRQCPSAASEREALALVAVATSRTLGLDPYPVQLMAALSLIRGYLAEMSTGEGKTLSSALAVSVLGWRGKPVHLFTANDYLAQRDCEEMVPLYQFCGLTAGYVVAEMEPDDRRPHYASDITCTTSKELLADFLRDRLKTDSINDTRRLLVRELLGGGGPSDPPVTRGIHTAVIDEADSVMIDDAATPLIISQKYRNEAFNECCEIAHQIANNLVGDDHYRVNFQKREIQITPAGYDLIETQAEQFPRMWQTFERSNELVKLSLTAREFFRRDKDYIIQDEKVVIIDPSTGRLKKDSTWRGGVHQAIEIKENLPISDPAQTLASLSFQRFFRLFKHLCATTGTVGTTRGEFWHFYKLPTVRIPTHRPCVRRQMPTRYFGSNERKFAAIVDEVKAFRSAGRPILIGTFSVEASEALAGRLEEEGLPFELINAAEHDREAAIIKDAGHPGRITLATNMAGRGTDIKLAKGVADSGGLHVICAERMESARVDRQLHGRAGRQGDPGSTQTFVSMEDDLLRQQCGSKMCGTVGQALDSSAPGAKLIAARLTNRAQREGEKKKRKQRESVMKMDHWLEESLAFSGSSGL
ncbi:MAG: hypothetical protein AAFX93_01540 [Verrucomicrobiota bacterium]